MNPNIGVYTSKTWLIWKLNNLTSKAQLVFDTLLVHLNYVDGYSWPSYPMIQSYTKLGRTSVWRALQELQNKRAIAIETIRFKGSRYKILVWGNKNKILPPEAINENKIECG